MNQKKKFTKSEEQKLIIQGVLTETIDDQEQGFHAFLPIQEVFGYPELEELNDENQ